MIAVGSDPIDDFIAASQTDGDTASAADMHGAYAAWCAANPLPRVRYPDHLATCDVRSKLYLVRHLRAKLDGFVIPGGDLDRWLEPLDASAIAACLNRCAATTVDLLTMRLRQQAERGAR